MRHTPLMSDLTTRKFSRAIALAALMTAGSSAIARTDPGIYFDLRVHGTGAKDATVYGPGDTLMLDLYATVVGANGSSSDDGIINVFSNFLSTNGGSGDLLGLTPPAMFNNLSASPGQQHDLDGDGDLDVGGGSSGTDSNPFYFSRGMTPHATPAGGLLIGQVRFTAVQLSAAESQIGWSTFSVPFTGSSSPILAVIDGNTVHGQSGDSMMFLGAPVTIHADQVFDPGTPTYINGAQNSHVNVAGTIRQGSGAAVVVDGGISLPAGSLFDMRNSSGQLNGQEIRVNDLTSGNDGGAAFVNTMVIGRTSSGKYSQSGGYTSIAGALTLGNSSGNDGSLVVAGGTLRAGAMKLGVGGNGNVSVTGGFLNAVSLDMNAASGVTSQLDVGGGIVTIGSGAIGGGAGNATLRVHDDGHFTANSTLTIGASSPANPGHVDISGGTFEARTLRMNGNVAIEQTGGTAVVSQFVVGNSSAAPATYTLTSGQLTSGTMFVGDINVQGVLAQNGGHINNSQTMYVADRYQLNAGDATTSTLYIHAPQAAAAGLVEQAGGVMTADNFVIAGTYRITGGTFTVNQGVEIIDNGTIDFANSPAAFAAGPNSLIQLPTGAMGNTSNAALRGGAGSLVSYPAGYNPGSHFASVSTSGLLHENGTALNIPQGKSITGAGAIDGSTTNHGAVNPGYGLGELDITGDYTQAGDGALFVDVGEGPGGATADMLGVSGIAQLAGTLRIQLLDGFKPSPDDTFTILAAGALHGTFANANSQVSFDGGIFNISYADGAVTLSNFVATPEPASIGLLAMASLGLFRRQRRSRA